MMYATKTQAKIIANLTIKSTIETDEMNDDNHSVKKVRNKSIKNTSYVVYHI